MLKISPIKPPPRGQAGFRFLGDLDENAEAPLADLVAAARVHTRIAFDLGQLKMINSIGVQRWLGFLRELPDACTYDLIDCSVTFMEYAAMLPSFTGRGRIVSFQVIYHCGSCQAQEAVSCVTDTVLAAQVFPERTCRKCGAPTSSILPFDELTMSLTGS